MRTFCFRGNPDCRDSWSRRPNRNKSIRKQGNKNNKKYVRGRRQRGAIHDIESYAPLCGNVAHTFAIMSDGNRTGDRPTKSLRRLFRALDRLPVPFAHFGQVENEAPRINVSIAQLIENKSGTINTSDYIYDEELRKLGVTVKFNGLDKVLADVSKNVLQDRSATADLRMIQIYRPGTTHTPYGNIKLFDAHVLTLCVTCEGDWTNAEGGGKIVLDKRAATDHEQWDGGKPGSYGCWYPTERLRLTRVEGSKCSYRVVLMYSVRVGGLKRKVSPEPLPWLSQASSNLSLLSNELGDTVLRNLGSKELCSISQSCTQLSEVRDYEHILVAMLLECKEELEAHSCSSNGEKNFSLGIPLQCDYRPHGSTMARYSGNLLFGRDYILFRAVKTAFPDASVICHRAVVRHEVQIDGRDTTFVLQGETEYHGGMFPPEDPEMQAIIQSSRGEDFDLPRGKTQWTWGAVGALVNHGMEILDDSIDMMDMRFLWPFFATRLVAGRKYMDRILSHLESYEGMESGRDSVNYYETSCLVIDFHGEDRKAKGDVYLQANEVRVNPLWIDD